MILATKGSIVRFILRVYIILLVVIKTDWIETVRPFSLTAPIESKKAAEWNATIYCWIEPPTNPAVTFICDTLLNSAQWI